jgi:uncharacterized protein
MFHPPQIQLPRRNLLSGLLLTSMGALAPSHLLAQVNPGQVNAGRNLMKAAHEASRFPSVRFGARLILQADSGPVRMRGLSGVSKLGSGGAENARRMRFDSPTDMRGVSTLTIERSTSADDLWIFLPSLGRVRRLVASNRRDAWVGSAFSFGDILGHKVDDWDHIVEGTEAIDGVACTRIASLPKGPGIARDTGYSKRLSWLRNTDKLLVRSDFHDLTGRRFKQLNQSDFRQVEQGRFQPFRVLMAKTDGSAASLFQFDSFRVDSSVSAKDVAPEALRI